MTRARQNGFTLLEVMIALSILFASLVGLLWRTTQNVRATGKAKMLTVATHLARAKMYDIEDELLHEGFQDTVEEMSGDFSDEGHPSFSWKAAVEKVKLPSLGEAETQLGEDGEGGPSGGPLGGLAELAGGFGDLVGAGQTGASSAGLGALMSQFDLVRGVLENGIRRVTLTVTWKHRDREESFDVFCYFTDPKAVDQAMQGGFSPAPGPGTGGGGP